MHVERVGYGPALPRCALSRTRSRPSAVCQRSRCVLNHVWLRPLARAQGVAAGAICANTVATGHDHDGQIHPPERCRSGVADGVAGGARRRYDTQGTAVSGVDVADVERGLRRIQTATPGEVLTRPRAWRIPAPI